MSLRDPKSANLGSRTTSRRMIFFSSPKERKEGKAALAYKKNMPMQLKSISLYLTTTMIPPFACQCKVKVRKQRHRQCERMINKCPWERSLFVETMSNKEFCCQQRYKSIDASKRFWRLALESDNAAIGCRQRTRDESLI